MIQRGNTQISYDILSGKVQSINGNQQTFSYHVNGQLLKTQTREAGMQTQILHLNSTLNKVNARLYDSVLGFINSDNDK